MLRGTRAGSIERFDRSVVAIGRHPLSDFRFDPETDLDVSTRHAELIGVDGSWTLRDLASTNGTFVNDERIAGERVLRDGDVIGFGANGPRASVRLLPGDAVSPATPAASRAPSAPLAPPRRDTTARVAEAVQEQTAAMRRVFVMALGALTIAGAGGFVMWQRQAARRERELLAVIERIESSSASMQKAIAEMRPRDSAFARLLAERAAASQRSVSDGRTAAGAGGSAASMTQLSQRLERDAQAQQSLSRVNLAGVHDQNEPAVAMVASDLEGTFIAGTAFAVTNTGLMVTNRHVVQTPAGQPPRRLRVIFGNTRDWLPAHVVRVSQEDDLALLQLEGTGTHPAVAGVSRADADSRVGAPVLSIGYPLAIGTPMEGTGLHVTARSTTAAGTVSKRLADVLQIDSYAGKGSSGSPVFGASGRVIGVVYGGAPELNGRIVYAVPAERLAGFLGGRGSVRE